MVLGPVAHYAESPAPAQDEEHPFCPCCLFTNSLDAFHGILRDGGYAAIRLYAARDANGEISADCRVNGEDYPTGSRPWPNTSAPGRSAASSSASSW
ncbi:hypothetical protein WJ970_11385 [Achromobacter xylosoxidans]